MRCKFFNKKIYDNRGRTKKKESNETQKIQKNEMIKKFKI